MPAEAVDRLERPAQTEHSHRPHSWNSPSASPRASPSHSQAKSRSPRQSAAQSRQDTVPTFRSSPTGSTLRANPFPKVTDPICRLPLPTLFYRPEASHLGDLLRIWVRSGVKKLTLSRIFKGQQECTGHRESRGAFREQRPYLRLGRFHGVRPLQRKDNSSQDSC